MYIYHYQGGGAVESSRNSGMADSDFIDKLNNKGINTGLIYAEKA